MRGGTTDPVEMLVVGGGINGTSIARNAAGRGLSVVLCDKATAAEPRRRHPAS